jgi:pimeloyl-ACP methyl ester carboxylesterase
MGVIRSISRGVALTGAVVAGGALVVTARSVLATPQPLESALEGEKHLFRFREGDIFYAAAGPQGAQPVLLLHSTHLSASSFEWRRNFSALSQEFRVYAPDLLGFGLSDRPALDYSANTYVTFISDFAREVIGRPAMVVARGQSAAFSARAAYLDPPLFSRLVFISPTGIAEAADGEAEQGGPIEALRGILRRVSDTTAGEVPYALLTTKSALSLFVARQSYAHSEQITPDLVRHLFATTHQHGARFAPLAFMTGKLDLPVASDFARLQQPALLVWGEQDAINDPLHAEALRQLNPHARLELISSAGNAVQDEQPHEINELLRAWFLAPPELVDPGRQPQRRAPQAEAERAPAPTAARPTTPLPEETRPTQPAPAAPTTAAPLAGETEAAAPSYVATPTDETPPAITRVAAEPPPQDTAAALGEVSPEAVQQADLPLPAASAALRSDQAALVPPAAEAESAEPSQPAAQAAEEAAEARDNAVAAAEDQTVQAGDLMTELEAQAATEMLGQLPANERPAAPTLEPEAPAATGPATTPAKPPTRATPRKPTPPKAAASRAPKTPGGQPPAHPEPHHPPQGGKSPGSRPSGSKKKR